MRFTFSAWPAGTRSQRVRPVAGVALSLVAAAAVSACTVTDLLSPRPDLEIRSSRAAMLAPSGPFMTGYPRIQNPFAAPPAVMPAEEIACRRDLKRLGVRFTDLPPIDDGGACRIDYPVEVSGLSGGISMQPAATLNCEMAAAVARWTKDELGPAARWRYFSGVKTIHQGSSYSCRRIRGSGTPSEHSRGNALDVMRIELENGRDIDVRRPGWFAFRQRGLLNSVRGDACDHFSTVLGPGYDADHKDHFHFDIKERRNGHKACR